MAHCSKSNDLGIDSLPHARSVVSRPVTRSRTVLPETLDGLAEDDPRAMRARRDLQRVNRFMGTRAIMLRGLRDAKPQRMPAVPLRVLELGAGDGSLALAIARKLSASWPAVNLTLLDRQQLVGADTIHELATLGWSAQSLIVDVMDWIAMPMSGSPRWDVIVTNLFLHHFKDHQLGALLRAIDARCNLFFACEPRRAGLPLLASHLIGALGANAVTREDAVLSVRAGFRGNEISTSWPSSTLGWQLQEYSAGLFSHCFRARRVDAGQVIADAD